MKTNSMTIFGTAALAVLLAATLFGSPAMADDPGPGSKFRAFTKTVDPWQRAISPREGQITLSGKGVQAYDPGVQAYDPGVRAHDPGIRQDDGKPISKKPRAFNGLRRAPLTVTLKFGGMNWRIKLIQPVWTPVLTLFTKPEQSE